MCLKFTRNQLDMKSFRKKTGGVIDNDEEYAEVGKSPTASKRAVASLVSMSLT